MNVEKMDTLSDEDYVIQRAKNAFRTDPITAKAWMITAKTLYPNNFAVQFEAYQIEKGGGNVKEAARNFSDLIGKFHQQPDFWNEINRVTGSLRSEIEGNDHEKQFYCDMFKHIEPEVQHKLLLITAEHCEDTMEHCKLLLLLLQKFPSAIQTHALGLIETLISAEKHSHPGNQPVNPFRKMLVHDLIPLLNNDSSMVEISQKLVYKILHKAIEYYLTSLNNSSSEQILLDAWNKLCITLEFCGKKLCWEPYLSSFGENWSKEHYWQKLLTFCQSQNLNLEDQNMLKQLLYCVTIFFLHCLQEYKSSLAPEPHPGQAQTSFLLLEAFVDKTLPNPITEPKSKRRKSDSNSELNAPYVTVEKSECKSIVNNFILTKKCWELLNSTDPLQREYSKLNSHLKLANLLHQFMIDYYIYKGQVDEALSLIQTQEPQINLKLVNNLRCVNITYLKKNYIACYNHILATMELLPANPGSLTSKLISGGTQRHLHFLPLTRLGILQYCTKLLIRAISEKNDPEPGDLAIGNVFVLSQLDWPGEEDRIPPLLELIRQRASFQYFPFQMYVVNVDILEELVYLFTRNVNLYILPHLEQRRIGTRGADKGAKEEVRQAIRRQVARSNESMDQLIAGFIVKERDHITQSLV